MSQGRVEDTIVHYRRLTREQPERAASQNELGYVLLRAGRAPEPLALQPDYPEAQFNLAQLYDRGRGAAADPSEAARLYRAAADQGHAGAQVNLGRLYRDGRGVARDDAAAAGWYQRAADRGQPIAQFNLAQMYASGRHRSLPRSTA